MILMLLLSALREISAFPWPSSLEHTETGAGQREVSHPSPFLQTLQANLPSSLALVSQYRATTWLPETPNPTFVELLHIIAV